LGLFWGRKTCAGIPNGSTTGSLTICLMRRLTLRWRRRAARLLINPPVACRFGPRCDYARDICKEQQPGLTVRGDDHVARCFATAAGGWIP